MLCCGGSEKKMVKKLKVRFILGTYLGKNIASMGHFKI